MESDDGTSAPAVQLPATEPTAAGDQPTYGRRRRRRQRQQKQQQQQPEQPQGPQTYAEMAAASLSPPRAGEPEVAPSGENPPSSPHGASPPPHQPSSSHTVPSDASNQSRRRPATVLGRNTSGSESSQSVPPLDEGQSLGSVQPLSRSAKKRRKRHARKRSLRVLTEEQHQAAQPSLDPEKGDDGASQMEETSSSMLSVQQSSERDEGEMSTAIPAGSTLSTRISPNPDVSSCSTLPTHDPPKRDESEIPVSTEVPSGSKLSTQDPRNRDGGADVEGPSGSILSTQDAPKRDEAETCTEVPSSSKLSTQDPPKHDEGGADAERTSGSTLTQDTTKCESALTEGPSIRKSPTPDTAKCDASTSTEEPCGSSSSTHGTAKRDVSTCTEGSGSSASSRLGTSKRDASTCTEGAGGSSSTEDTTKLEVAICTEGPSSSTSPRQDTSKREAPACTEGPGSSSSSTHQQKSHVGDLHSAQGTSQDVQSPSAMLPGTSKYQSTFPTIEEIRSRLRCRTRTRSNSLTENQGSRQKNTDSSDNTAQEKEGAADPEDTDNVKRSPNQCSTADSPSSSRIDAGADGSDVEDSPDTGSFRSSIEPPWVYEDTFRDLQMERDREEYIMSVINNCASTVSNLTGNFTQVIAEIFGDAKLGSEGAGPSGVENGSDNAVGNTDTGGIEPPEYDDTHAEILEDIKAYVRLTYVEAAAHQAAAGVTGELAGPIDLEALAQALWAASTELSSQSAQRGPAEDPTDPEHFLLAGPSTSYQAQAGSSASAQAEPVAHCSKQPDPTASGRDETSPRRAFLRRFYYDILTVAVCRVYKMRGSCMMFFNGIVALVSILSLALETYRGVQQVVDRIVRPPYAAESGIVAAVTDGAIMASERLRRALSEAEKAMRIHYQFSNTLKDLQQLLATLKPDQPKAHEITDRPALLEQVVSLLEQSCDFIDREWLRTGTGLDSAVTSPPPPEGTPLEGFETLLVATQVAFQAVESAMTSLDVIYACEVSRATDEQDDTDTDTDDDDE